MLCLVLTVTTFSSCKFAPTDVRILSVENSAASAISHIFELTENKNNYISSAVNLPNRVRTLIADGECDVAVIPIETATALYRAKNPEIKILAGISVGGFELIANKSIKDFSELKEQTIYLTERSSIMESLLKYAISLYNVNPFKEVKISYVADTTKLKKLLEDNTASFALVTSADKAKIAPKNTFSYNLTDVLSQKLKNPSIINYCVIATKDFVDKNSRVIKQLLKDIENSVKNSSNAEETLKIAKKHNLLTDDFYDEEFLKSCKPQYISGKKLKEKLSAYYNLLKKIKASSTGTSFPEDDFYYDF